MHRLRVLALVLGLAVVPTAPAAAQLAFKLDETDLVLSGYLRVRGTGEFNFDLAEATKEDEDVTFYDLRSWLGLEVRHKPFKGLFSLDLAGDEFNDGIVLGNENPAFNRELDARVRHLYVEYNGPLNLRLGRVPAQLGRGIVSHIVRDAFRVWKDAGIASVSLGVIKGGEALATTPGTVKPRPINVPTGEDDDLDAVAFYTEVRPSQTVKARLEVLGHIDSSPNDRFPQKLHIDLNSDGKLGPRFSYAAEAAYFGGRTPDTGQGTLDNQGYMLYLDGAYALGRVSPGFAFGLGSGDDDPIDDEQGNFQNFFMDETGFHYTNLFADDIHGYDGTAASLARGSGFANVTFFQPHVVVRPAPAWEVSGSVTLLTATEDRVEGTGPLGDRPATGTEFTGDIGEEIDLNVTYKASNQVSLFALLGYFNPGQVFGADADDAFKGEIGSAFRL